MSFEAGIKEAFFQKFKAKRAIKQMGGIDAVKKLQDKLFWESAKSGFGGKARKAHFGILEMRRKAGM